MSLHLSNIHSENMTYKEIHENYMMNHKGSTIWESFFLIAPYPLVIYFVSYVVNLTFSSKLSLLAFLSEFFILVVPIVFTFTVINGYNHIIFFSLLFMFVLSLLNLLQKRNKNFIKIIFTMVLPPENRPYITYFRAICNILTAFCILAVDFTIFPRRFAKTESYGFGLMDTGVGFYIVSNGIVAKQNIQEHLGKAITRTLPILAIGILRCIIVKTLNYQEHMSEYGVHWNFFITLSIVKLACPIILSYFPNFTVLIATILAIFHQAALSFGIESWVLSDGARNGLLEANREGICSLPGYMSLYFASVYIGKALYRDSIDLQADILHLIQLFAASVIFFFFTVYFNSYFEVSRRLINITYITWILGSTFMLLSICILVEIGLRIFHFVEGNMKNENLVPIIIDSVNYNGLTFFLLSNLLTGVINITLKTLTLSPVISITVLLVYMLFLCYVVSFMFRYRIRV